MRVTSISRSQHLIKYYCIFITIFSYFIVKYDQIIVKVLKPKRAWYNSDKYRTQIEG